MNFFFHKMFNIFIFILVIETVLQERGIIEVTAVTDDEMSTATQNNVEIFENIIKSSNDKRSYRGIKLRNNLKVLLISDPTTNKAAASLSVRAGSLNDFDDLPGTANLLGHVLLHAGTRKYPEPNGFKKFLLDHSGLAEVAVLDHSQNFCFEVHLDFLGPVLDRFVQFFLDPLMEESDIESNITLINVKYTTHVFDDNPRRLQVLKALGKANHPFNRFMHGNLETLLTVPRLQGISVRERLLQFYSMYFSSNIMYLTVLGKESLDKLQDIVTPLFEMIENKNLATVVNKEHPWGAEQLRRVIYIVPLKEERNLKLIFPIPDLYDTYRTSPMNYVRKLLMDEGPSSLLTVLQIKNLANGLSTIRDIHPGFGFFAITINLTQEAMSRIDEVITLVFQYINLLKANGIQEWIFLENKRLCEINFRFKEDEPPLQYVKKIISLMPFYPMEDILCFEHKLDRWEPTVIERFLSFLTPENMNVLVSSKSFEGIVNTIEPFYKAKYKVEAMTGIFIEKWKNCNPSPELEIPAHNEFIPDTFDLYSLSEDEPKEPYIIQESSISRFWFKQDDQFKIPKLIINFELFSPVSCADPSNVKLMKIYVALLSSLFRMNAYGAKAAGMVWKATATNNCGIHVTISGCNDKLPLLVEKLISQITNFSMVQQGGERTFEFTKESVIQALNKFETEMPHTQAHFYASHLLSANGHTTEQLLTVTKDLQFEDLLKFLQQLFTRVFIQGFIYGNCNKQKAMEIIQMIEMPFKSTPGMAPQQLFSPRIIELKEGANFRYEIFNRHHSSSSYYVYFQISNTDLPFNSALLSLFLNIVQEPCIRILKTQEQLGSIVSCGILKTNNEKGYVIRVTTRRHPVYVEYRVEKFLLAIRKMLEDLTEQELDAYKVSTMKMYTEKPKTFMTESTHYWGEITNMRYSFNRQGKIIEQLQVISKTDLVEFFKEFLDKSTGKRRKLAVHVISQVTNPPFPVHVPVEGTKIEDIHTFKITSSLLPCLRQREGISPLGVVKTLPS